MRPTIQQVMQDASRIQGDYSLCDSCLGRLYAKRLSLSSNRLLGKRIRRGVRRTKCYICRDMIDNLDLFHLAIADRTRDHQFASFMMGVILRPSVMERDDLVRSRYKLMGIDSVKTDISRQLAKRLAQRTKSKIDHAEPELIVTVDLKNESVELHSKSVILAGRYTKSSRGLPQKQKPCADCWGKGCTRCSYHGISGFESIEGRISEFLYEKFRARQTKVTWIGGEDKTSLVRGTGRPFFVRVINPQKRRARLPKKIDLDEVCLLGLRRVPSVRSPVRFRSKISLSVDTDGACPPLGALASLRNSRLAIYQDSKRTEKSVYSVRYRKTSASSFVLSFEADGGVPIRRFVGGDTVFPNLSDLLEVRCICRHFDFDQILIQ